MARHRETEISSEDLQEYLATQDDFALELFVYSKARSLGFNATHGGTYVDPVTKKPRQYDVRANMQRDERRIDLAIECKSLRTSYPLLVSRIPRVADESYHHVIYSYKPTSSPFDPTTASLNTWKTLVIGRGPLYLYPAGEFVGKATVQVGRHEKGGFVAGDSEVYDKWTQALGSVDELISDAGSYWEDSTSESFATALLPVLVVSDGALWVADYAEDGAVQGSPRQTDEALLFVGRDYGSLLGPPFTATHLHIYTRTGVDRFLNRIASDQTFWQTALPPKEILHAFGGGGPA